MFGFFTSELRRARHDARNWLHLADKIFHYRRDQLPPPELLAIQQGAHELKTRLREKADVARLKMAMEKLEVCLRRSGGTHYPKSSIADNAEFFLVAAILFLGVRTFFLQPFKIPTNSMWPTYYGMTAEVYETPEDEPGSLGAAFRFLAFGATTRRIDAPVDGEVVLPLIMSDKGVTVAHTIVAKRRWLVLPGQARRYTFLVGGSEVTVTLPLDFRFDRVVEQFFFKNHVTLMELWQQNHGSQTRFRMGTGRDALDIWAVKVPTGHRVKAGGRALSFDVMTGDQLFVDRVTYHFFRPEVGQGFVFRTGHIPRINGDQFYIKRLVGVPGDTLEVREPVLFRNGKSIDGADAFRKNAELEGHYPGYVNRGALGPGNTVNVPPQSYFAMGDNSPDSSDSRFWGFVPAADVVGRPLFIYYPFTRRWGPAR